MKKFFIICIAFLFALFSAGYAFYWEMIHYIQNPIEESLIEETIQILPGASFEGTLDQLSTSGIVKDQTKFRLLARFKGYDKRIKAGEYHLSTRMSPEDILGTLVSGRSILYRFTIPEGYNLNQIANVIEHDGWGSGEEFLLIAYDPEFTQSFEIKAQTMEGYLFPETYFFPKGAKVKEIITTMVRRFQKVFTEEKKKRAEELGLTIHQVVTLASIIEKETGKASERPVISSVFHNRLKKRMRLESDPTVIYGIKNFNGNITRKDLNTPTPYNTYKIKGLPPGPIASPGEKSIDAVLYPANTKFLFFVSKKDGTHHFSRTIREHRQAVQKYQLSR